MYRKSIQLVFIFFVVTSSSINQQIDKKVPPKRNFIPLPGSVSLNNAQSPVTFRILQLNVLADGLSGRRPDLGQFSRISSPDVLEWNVRKTKLLHEISQYKPDVITMLVYILYKFLTKLYFANDCLHMLGKKSIIITISFFLK